MLDEGKEALATTTLDALPEVILKMPDDSITPLLSSLALTVAFAALLARQWWVVAAAGVVCLFIVLLWLWPRRHLGQRARPAHE